MVARLHTINQTKNPHEFYLSKLQLYTPFVHEAMLHPDSLDGCKDLCDEVSEQGRCQISKRKVSNVKKILMKHLEAVESETDRAKDILESNAGATLDAENEQDNANCGLEERTCIRFCWACTSAIVRQHYH